MKYKVKIVENIEKKLKKFPPKDKSRILEKIDALTNNPRPQDCKKLQGNRKPPLYRVRSEFYRILYNIKDEVLLILIVDIGHRKDIYR